ncbi:MAG: phytoene/squalene synthase family protein [Anaerolineae bacterium]
MSFGGWEERLLRLAGEADRGCLLAAPEAADRGRRGEAYRACAEVTRLNSRTFYLATSLLPPTKRPAMHALYAFCRLSDDIVDRAGDEQRPSLDAWRREVFSISSDTAHPVALAWRDTAARHHIPRRYAEQLVDAVAQDLVVKRYRTFEDLVVYCYGVAATVGLMAMHIIGYSGEDAIPGAIKLGVALQLTNILRDIGEDWRAGRLYLPQEELEDFRVSEDEIAGGLLTHRWRSLMDFQIERARRLYAESLPALARLSSDGRFAIAAAAELYRGILGAIEDNCYNVFSHRARVSDWGKVRQLPAIWLRSRTLAY